jgi:VIT1/CCC1 family predicted Fe2+/Mn2+ transporter
VTVLVALGLGFVLASLVPADPGTFVLSGLSIGLVLAGLATFVGGFVYGSKKVRPLVQPRRIGVTVGLTAAAGR